MSFYDYLKIDNTLNFYFVWCDGEVVKTSFDNKIIKNMEKRDNEKIKKLFENYFFHRKPLTDIPYKFGIRLTEFEKLVLKETHKIPFGKTITYKAVADRIGRENSYRAVGNALGKNPLPVIIPCHRVLSKTGLGGFTGGLDIKKYLLKIEGLL